MIQLSVEEVAFIFGYIGEHDFAAGYLHSIIGQQDSQNLSGRMTASSHSLLARGYLLVDDSLQESSLEPSIESIAQNIVAAIESNKPFDKETIQDVAESEMALFDSLLSLKSKLEKIEEEDRRRNWANEGLSFFIELLRKNHEKK